MPDSKITALTALTAADPANDMIPIVDVSDTPPASGNTKRISINNILACSPTATLASATITGNLTAAAVIPSGSTVPTNGLYLPTANNLGFAYNSTLGMTLNSTGLGVGGSPLVKLSVIDTVNTFAATFRGNIGTDIVAIGTTALGASINAFTAGFGAATNLVLQPNGGNVGIGVAPSAWGSNWKANHVGTVGSFASSGAGSAPPTAMVIGAYNDNTNWKYQFSSTGAARYEMTGANAGSAHAWYTAPGGTVNNNITFTQAMTLAANGQLLLGTSTTEGAIDIGMVLNKPSATGFVGNCYQLNGSSKAFTYISSAAGAFRVDTVTGYTINMVSDTNGVYLANGGTSWTALSDERFKDIIEPISNAVAKVGSIRSVIGKFKAESEGTRRSFLIAQDVQAVLPEAVDASNPEKLGVSYTEVIPLLVAAIKELTAEVNALKNA